MQQLTLPGSGLWNVSIENLQTGELKSFQRLYQGLKSDLLSYAEEWLANKEEAPDVVKHAFINCWLHCDELTSINYILAFLNLTIRKSCMAIAWRNPLRSAYQHKLLTTLVTGPGGETSPVERAIAVRHLPSEQLLIIRELFAKFYNRYMMAEDIVREMGLPLAYVREKLNLAFSIVSLIFFDEDI